MTPRHTLLLPTYAQAWATPGSGAGPTAPGHPQSPRPGPSRGRARAHKPWPGAGRAESSEGTSRLSCPPRPEGARPPQPGGPGADVQARPGGCSHGRSTEAHSGEGAACAKPRQGGTGNVLATGSRSTSTAGPSEWGRGGGRDKCQGPAGLLPRDHAEPEGLERPDQVGGSRTSQHCVVPDITSLWAVTHTLEATDAAVLTPMRSLRGCCETHTHQEARPWDGPSTWGVGASSPQRGHPHAARNCPTWSTLRAHLCRELTHVVTSQQGQSQNITAHLLAMHDELTVGAVAPWTPAPPSPPALRCLAQPSCSGPCGINARGGPRQAAGGGGRGWPDPHCQSDWHSRQTPILSPGLGGPPRPGTEAPPTPKPKPPPAASRQPQGGARAQ